MDISYYFYSGNTEHEDRHDANFATSGAKSCHFDSLRYHQ